MMSDPTGLAWGSENYKDSHPTATTDTYPIETNKGYTFSLYGNEGPVFHAPVINFGPNDPSNPKNTGNTDQQNTTQNNDDKATDTKPKKVLPDVSGPTVQSNNSHPDEKKVEPEPKLLPVIIPSSTYGSDQYTRLIDRWDRNIDTDNGNLIFLVGPLARLGGLLSLLFRVKKADEEATGACFTSDTMIMTEKGLVPIIQIKPGDKVYSKNTDTGEQGLKEVVKVFVHEVNQLVNLKLEDGSSIKTTQDHPFWVVGKGFVKVKDLNVKDTVVLYSNQQVKIKDIIIQNLTNTIKVYNFEVADWHTYFVGGKSVLVHNSCYGGKFKGGKQGARDSWYGYNNKDFQHWWHRQGKDDWGGNDIDSKEMAAEAYEHWILLGKPIIKK